MFSSFDGVAKALERQGGGDEQGNPHYDFVAHGSLVFLSAGCEVSKLRGSKQLGRQIDWSSPPSQPSANVGEGKGEDNSDVGVLVLAPRVDALAETPLQDRAQASLDLLCKAHATCRDSLGVGQSATLLGWLVGKVSGDQLALDWLGLVSYEGGRGPSVDEQPPRLAVGC